MNVRAITAEAGGRVDELRTAFDGKATGTNFLFLRQQWSFQDHLHRTVIRGLHHVTQFAQHVAVFSIPKLAHVQDHIHFVRAVIDSHFDLVALGVGWTRPQWKASDGDDFDVGAVQEVSGQLHAAAVHANAEAPMLPGFGAEFLDVFQGGIGSELRQFDARRQLSG